MKKLLLVLAAGVFTLTACEKEGPEGPQGPQGEKGEQGEAADFIIKDMTVRPYDWAELNNPGDPMYGFHYAYPLPELTSPVLENSVIMGYYKNGTSLVPLPFTMHMSGWATQYTFMAQVGAIDFLITDDDNLTIKPTSDVEYRIVIAEASMKKSDIEKMIFEETGMSVLEVK